MVLPRCHHIFTLSGHGIHSQSLLLRLVGRHARGELGWDVDLGKGGPVTAEEDAEAQLAVFDQRARAPPARALDGLRAPHAGGAGKVDKAVRV